MDTGDRRRSPRVEAHLPVTLRIGRSEEHLLSAEVGLRGVFVVTDAPRPLRQLVTLGITLADGTLFEVQGMVSRSVGTEEAWTQGIPSGMGIQFYGLSQAASERWEAFLQEAERRHDQGLSPFGLDQPIEPADAQGRGRGEASAYVPPPPGIRGKGKATGLAPARPAAPSRPPPGDDVPELDGPSTSPDLEPSSMDDTTEARPTREPLLEDEPDTVRGKGERRVRIAVAGAGSPATQADRPGPLRASAPTARYPVAGRIPEELRDKLVERQGAFGAVTKPPAPKAPDPIEPFGEAQIPTRISNTPAALAAAPDDLDDDRMPDQTLEHVRPADPDDRPSGAPVSFALDDLAAADDDDSVTSLRGVVGRGEPPDDASVPTWKAGARAAAPPDAAPPDAGDDWDASPAAGGEGWMAAAARPTAPAPGASTSPPPRDLQLAPDATSGAAVYRLELPTLAALEEFGKTALPARGVVVRTADVRPPGTPAVVCVLHPVSGDEFHLPGEVVPLQRGGSGVAVGLTGVTARTVEDFQLFVALGIPDDDQTHGRPRELPPIGDWDELTAVKAGGPEAGSERAMSENTLDIKASDLEILSAELPRLDVSDEALSELTSDLPDLFPTDDET